MKTYFIGLLFLLTVTSVSAETSIEEANCAYNSGDFNKSVQLYKKIIEEKGESSAVYYNLGNSYYRLKQTAYAILYYERSILINPHDKEARFNLEIAKLTTIDKESVDSFFLTQWILSFQDRCSIFQWSTIGICCFVFLIICLGIFCFSYTRRYKKIGFYFGWILLFFCIISNIFAYNQKENQLCRRTAVIVAPTITIKSSPDYNGKGLFILHEGSKVKVKDMLNHWIRIETLSGGHTGWVQSHDLEII